MSRFTDEDDALLGELGVETTVERPSNRTPKDERIIAGFEEIQRFVDEHGRPPRHGEGNDIFERLYAVRLDRIRDQEECRSLLSAFDRQGLLTVAKEPGADLDDDALLAELGVDNPVPGDITDLKHVRSTAERQAAEEIAARERCADFERFKPLFELVKRELDTGIRKSLNFGIRRKDSTDSAVAAGNADVSKGEFFILGGQMVYVAEIGEPMKTPNGETDARLRAIFSNGTESNLLKRSLQSALYKDEHGRRISEPSAGPLFSDERSEGDEASGTIYVLRSRSEDPAVSAHREVLHKIGVTGGDVKKRLANARLDSTFLMAEVEIVRTYELYNINRTRFENLIHRIFGSAQLDVTIKDRFGNPIVPREWFLVPLHVVDQAIDLIKDGTIAEYRYDPKTASLSRAKAKVS